MKKGKKPEKKKLFRRSFCKSVAKDKVEKKKKLFRR